jgi:zinc/manganese transport system substrate-binding protein
MRKGIASGIVGLIVAISSADAAPLKIVAAESVYGDVARQIGGENVSVTSILTNPDQDPHEFEASATTAREIANAMLIICNGADYDPWAFKLSSASRSTSRKLIVVADLVGKKAGDNPHVWYLPTAVPALADVLADMLSKLDTVHKDEYARRLAAFQASLKPLGNRIDQLRKVHAGTTVTATEPVFGYMADALGLEMRNSAFQLAVMNGTEPSATAIAAFEKDVRTRTVKVLFYNNQTGNALAGRMRMLAVNAGVPIVGISETEPTGKTYQEWMLSQLDALAQALARP